MNAVRILSPNADSYHNKVYYRTELMFIKAYKRPFILQKVSLPKNKPKGWKVCS